MKFEWDISELIDFANNLSNLTTFKESMERSTQEIAKALLKRIKALTPIEDGQLISGWNGNQFIVTENKDGYEVLLVNTTPYAPYVNDGHMAYNQYGGPYPIHPENRVKVTTPYQWQQGDATYYVFGHFFVERGILQLCNTTEIEQIIMKELQKWWDSV